MNTQIEAILALDIDTLNKQDLKEAFLQLKEQIELIKAARGTGRKEQVLDILKLGPASILEIAEACNMSSKNVSSQLTYLKKDGIILHTNEKQQKFIVEPTIDLA